MEKTSTSKTESVGNLEPGEAQSIPVEDREDLACLGKEEGKFGTLHTDGKTLSWEMGAKAQCLAVGENTNTTDLQNSWHNETDGHVFQMGQP